MKRLLKKIEDIYKPGLGARQFLCSLLFWGIASGCFGAIMNNYLSEIIGMSPVRRGDLEFFREMPGLLLFLFIALMYKYSEWRILKISLLFSLAGVFSLVFYAGTSFVMATLLIVLFSTGEHLAMPVRSNLAMTLAKDDYAGRSLGILTSLSNAGIVIGSLLTALVFWSGSGNVLQVENRRLLYAVVWALASLLIAVALACVLRFRTDGTAPTRRPRLYFHRKYTKFYGLEIFYGARKQIFMTFAPYVLIQCYHVMPQHMAILLGLCALVNIFCAPQIGRIIDYLGYRTVMIWDTIILFFVCIAYGYADKIFPASVAYYVVCLNYLLDAVLTTTSMSSSMYVRDISDSPEETSSTLSTGISINHLISIFAALIGGRVWQRYGVGVLFTFSAIMGLCNSAFAYTIPAPRKRHANL